MSRTLPKFSLPFDEATTSVHFPKTLKRPRNNAGPASLNYLSYSRGYLPDEGSSVRAETLGLKNFYESSNRRMKQLMDWLSISH